MSTELLLLGFASLILAAFSGRISAICGAIMHSHHGQLPCLQSCTQCVSVPLLSGASSGGTHDLTKPVEPSPWCQTSVWNCATAHKQ